MSNVVGIRKEVDKDSLLLEVLQEHIIPMYSKITNRDQLAIGLELSEPESKSNEDLFGIVLAVKMMIEDL